MGKAQKYFENRSQKERVFKGQQALELIIVMEACEFAHAKQEDLVLDLDTHKFYDYCYDRILKNVVKKSCEYNDLDEQTMLFSVRMKWAQTISQILLNYAERLRFLNLVRSFIQDYENYLNDKE